MLDSSSTVPLRAFAALRFGFLGKLGLESVAPWPNCDRLFIYATLTTTRADTVEEHMGDFEKRLETFLSKNPTLGAQVYIARGAVVLGDVTLGDYSSVWSNAVLRGDINRITVGHHTNIQDTAVVHLADELECVIGDYTTIGHGAIVHACKVGNEVLVGMRSTILDGVEIGDQSIIGAASLVTKQTRIPAGSLVWGVPARIVRALTVEERAGMRSLADKYVELATYYLRHSISTTPITREPVN